MARIRTIKPEFFTSEDIVGLSPLARLLYIAIWCESDKEGRLIWKPKTFKLRYLPADNCDADALSAEIVGAGLVVLYGDGLAVIPAFRKHQHINPRESASVLPDPDALPEKLTRRHASPRVNSKVDAQVGREGKGREGISETTSPHPPAGGEPSGFDEFWLAWPKSERKQDKAKCSEHWKRHSLGAVSAAILADVRIKRGTEKWREGYIEAPLVYLNGRRWEDGVTPGEADLTPVNGAADKTAELLRQQAEHASRAVAPPANLRALVRQITGVA